MTEVKYRFTLKTPIFMRWKRRFQQINSVVTESPKTYTCDNVTYVEINNGLYLPIVESEEDMDNCKIEENG